MIWIPMSSAIKNQCHNTGKIFLCQSLTSNWINLVQIDSKDIIKIDYTFKLLNSRLAAKRIAVDNKLWRRFKNRLITRKNNLEQDYEHYHGLFVCLSTISELRARIFWTGAHLPHTITLKFFVQSQMSPRWW